jgi:hypothetical protein
MAFQLQEIVPWGRSFDEYRRMFALSEEDLEAIILGCGDGPASFNSSMHHCGKRVVSVDPLYQFSREQIRERIQAAYQSIMEQMIANESAYVWTVIPSLPELGRLCMVAMEEFLEDYEAGKQGGRYLPHELPQLPFADHEFDLALCSHLLFTYSAQLSVDFHTQALLEMCRVAKEVRVFPLLDHGGQPSPHLDPICRSLNLEGYRLSVQTVDYEFQRGSNQMLRVWQ